MAHRPLIALRVSSIADVLSSNGPPNTLQGVVVPVDHTLFELNDGVIGDLDACGADFGAASSDVAVLNPEFLLDFWNTVLGVKGVHFVLSQSHKVTRSGEIIEQGVVSKDVARVDAEETFDAFAEMLHSVSFHLVEFPIHGFRTADGSDSLGDFVVPTDISNEVLDVGERLHGSDFNGLACRRLSNDITHSGHAHQAWAAVDFSGT